MECKICGKDFELKLDNHYIARDEEIERCGIVGIVGNNTDKESKLYDTFDCPFCGCQNVVQERKRSFMRSLVIEKEELEDECNKEIKEETTECECDCNRDCEGCWGEYICEEAKRKESEEV